MVPNPRTPAPSRIGKTLGAILSAPRRGAGDADAGDEVVDVAAQPDRAGDSAAAPERVARPTTPVTSAPDRATSERSENDSTVATHTRATSVEPPSLVAPTSAPVEPAPVRSVVDAESTEATNEGGGTRRKKRETFLIPEDLAEAMRNAIVHLSGPPLYYTLAEFGEHAIRNYIAQLEREHNGGQSFPRRPRAVRQGRPLR